MSHNVHHDPEIYRTELEPDLLKKVDENLTISLSYLNQNSPESTECLISFHNTSNKKLNVNPSKENEENLEVNSHWYSKFFGGSEIEQPLVEQEVSEELKIFLGYIQLFGYIVLNYQLDLEESSSLLENSKNPWWFNKEYINEYHDYSTEFPSELKESKLNNMPFIRKKWKNPLVIGGKLGGISDLVVENKTSDIKIDRSNRYLINDLLYTFNSQEYLSSGESYDSNEEAPMKDLLESIIPIYSTSQDLLFTDLSIAPSSTKTFHIKFPRLKNLPPSYNTRSTGPVCDQGLISIKYSLIIGVSLDRGIKPVSVYFPMYLKPDRAGIDRRWLQRKYSDEVQFDANLKFQMLSSEVGDDCPRDSGMEIFESRKDLLQDLSTLIISDLHDLPKISQEVRHKSIGNIETANDDDLVPQLPNHLKTHYQIRVNKDELCLINLTKPYYHIGEDINFTININPIEVSTTKVVGFIVYLEACEKFQMDNDESEVNYYKVTPSIKINCFAPAMINSESKSKLGNFITGYLNIPKYLTSQFQYSNFMSLKYFLVFKFNLINFEGEETQEPKSRSVNGQKYTQLNDEDTFIPEDRGESEIQNSENPDNKKSSVRPDISDDSNSNPNLHPNHNETNHVNIPKQSSSSRNGSITEGHFLDFTQHYKSYNEGNEMRFRLPIVLLP